MVRYRVALVLSTWVVAACSSAAVQPAQEAAPERDDDSGHAILDQDDRCPIILDCEEGFIDFDGCPDVILVFDRDSAALTDRHRSILGELAVELDTRKQVVRLRIDGHAATGEAELVATRRAEAVRDGLVARGVPAAMLETRADRAPEGSSGFVSFFALECAQ